MSGTFPGLAALGLCIWPAAGPELPTQDDAARRGLAWLEKNMSGKRRKKARAIVGNVGAKRLVATSMARFVALQTPEHESRATRLWDRTLLGAVARKNPSLGIFASWIDGFVGLCLAERSLRDGKPSAALRRIVRDIESRQNPEGGWGHGMSLGSRFYPTTLIAASNWSLLVLGLAASQGVGVDSDVLDEALELYVRVQAGSGALPYGGLPYRKGFEAGRTSGTVVALERTEGELFRRAARYLRRNRSKVPNGHASPAMHVLTGALASWALGDADWKAYETTVLARVRAAQKSNGSFDDIQERSSDTMRIMTDERTNRAYVTALYSAALSVSGSHVGRALRMEVPPEPAIAPSVAAPSLPSIWETELHEVEAIRLHRERVLVLGGEGSLSILDAASGEQQGAFSVGGVGRGRISTHGGDVLVWIRQQSDEDLPASIAEVLKKKQRSEAPERIVSYSTSENRIRWTRPLPSVLAKLLPAPDGLQLLMRNGRLFTLSYETGRLEPRLSTPPMLVNGGLARLAGSFFVGAESRLVAFDAQGDELWKRRTRAGLGVTPPAIAALATGRERLYVGTTSGEVWSVSVETGKRLWRLQLGAGVQRLVVPPASDPARGLLLAVTYAGSVHGIRDGRLSWSVDVVGGAEAPHAPRLVLLEASVWAGSAEAGRLVEISLPDGELLRALPLPEGARWSADDRHLVIAAAGRLRCHPTRK
ncbi:MAG: PQQ-binding-like beta-propeller repeat protein [Planctomycetota bacterium]